MVRIVGGGRKELGQDAQVAAFASGWLAGWVVALRGTRKAAGGME